LSGRPKRGVGVPWCEERLHKRVADIFALDEVDICAWGGPTLWDTNPCRDELIQRVHLSVFPGGLLLFAAEACALAHGTRLATAAHLASFLVLRAFLEASLRHVAIQLGAADLRP